MRRLIQAPNEPLSDLIERAALIAHRHRLRGCGGVVSIITDRSEKGFLLTTTIPKTNQTNLPTLGNLSGIVLLPSRIVQFTV